MEKEEILNILQSTTLTNDLKVKTLLDAIFNIDDWNWLQNLCIKMSSSSDENISGLAVTGIGHIARMHQKLDKDVVVPFLNNILLENNHLSGRASDALEDIEIFIKS
jgi:hypothetical protein